MYNSLLAYNSILSTTPQQTPNANRCKTHLACNPRSLMECNTYLSSFYRRDFSSNCIGTEPARSYPPYDPRTARPATKFFTPWQLLAWSAASISSSPSYMKCRLRFNYIAMSRRYNHNETYLHQHYPIYHSRTAGNCNLKRKNPCGL